MNLYKNAKSFHHLWRHIVGGASKLYDMKIFARQFYELLA